MIVEAIAPKAPLSAGSSLSPPRALTVRRNPGPVAETTSMDDPPPPYTLIDRAELLMIEEDLVGFPPPMTPVTSHCGTLIRGPTIIAPTSPIQEIREGGEQVFNSIKFLVLAILLAAGHLLQGIGRMLIGFGGPATYKLDELPHNT